MRSLLACCAVLIVPLAAGCGGSSDKGSASQASQSAPNYAAPTLADPPKPAPPLALRNYDGRRVDLASFRGKAVLVTFLYTHCPDTCPLIVSNLRTARKLLGAKASRLQIVAVSTDPAQDTPASVRSFLAKRLMLGRMDYLLGSRGQLRRVWAAWGIKAKRVSPRPAEVEHSALIYGITAGGKLTTLYPANFKPQWVAHDVPLLAAR